ncbi:hypothetical protein E4K67_28265 [Desulfosporosinus fructosivorans]|uniref:DUF6385 domain-containing protein n=1 Tax=Desulfosporosinus fructosivorans TaxID=2018669 RepID=A0A4Z0QVR7_9FIRM|nr:DUF6385 domain-containing protein [Desulfosporosinus fructosivorans]TGE34902.1 hypothetical protein E4K67_28265 [Desulfosporosinus fructosivorans]
MEKNLLGLFSKLYNGNFQIISRTQSDFPDAWLQIGGNYQTDWKFKNRPLEGKPVLEIKNSTAPRAGIIQTSEASLDILKDADWQILMVLKSGMPELQAYLRIYPVRSNGEVLKPWEFSFRPGLRQEQFKQAISVGSEIRFLRLETGVLGPGDLYIYKLMAYPLAPIRMKRRVKKVKMIEPINHIQTIGEIIKPIQLAMPIPLKIPVTVQANVNADIRNLTPTRDKVQIFGSSQAPLATSICGRAQVEISGHGFQESLEDVTADQTMSSTTTRDVSALSRFSFAVYNFGTESAHVQAELSPDGVHWAGEGNQLEVSPGKLVIIIPEKFLRYTRLSYKAEGLTTLRIWVQAQN